MRTSILRYLVAGALSAAAMQSAAAAGELVVIVSAKSTVNTLKPEQVADIFLGQIASFPGGVDVVALDQTIGSPVRDEFYAKVAAKSRPLVKAHWTKMIFTGRGQPPREIGDSEAVRKKVAENPSLIGYIDKAALDSSVKAVLLVR